MADLGFINSQAELDAINDILAVIGENAVTSVIGADDNADVQNASRCLRAVNKEIQSKGWTFNTYETFTLTPDIFSKQIPYLDSYLRVLSTSGATVYRRRNDLVYDATANTDKFTDPITVKMVLSQSYDDMPECFRRWIVTTASRKFNTNFFGDAGVEAILQEEEKKAMVDCMEYEMDYGDFNMLAGDTFTSGRLGRV